MVSLGDALYVVYKPLATFKSVTKLWSPLLDQVLRRDYP
jgi:hypothetical protein